MTPTPVGMRCPECARQTHAGADACACARRRPGRHLRADRDQRRSSSSPARGGRRRLDRRGGSVVADGALFGPAVADGDWWRLVTGGLPARRASLHIALQHVRAVHPRAACSSRRSARCASSAIYFVSLLAGSFGALLLSSPNELTVGASGAIFGLMGAGDRRRCAPAGSTRCSPGSARLILINLLFTFPFPGDISIGGHIGGLVGGLATALRSSRARRSAAHRARAGRSSPAS